MSHHLIKAASDGKLDKLLARLEQGDDKDSQHKGTGRSALAEASINGHLPVVQYLLSVGARFDDADKALGYTPLLWASSLGHTAIVELLLTHGAELNFASKPFGFTALMLAAASAHGKSLQYLMARGADLHAMTSDGRNAFSMALQNRHQAIADLLSQAGSGMPTPQAPPTGLPWPAQTQADFKDAASVLHHFILAMHAWELDAANNHIKRIDGQKEHDWGKIHEEMAAIFAQYCTPRERPYGRNGGSFSSPPAYQPEEQLLEVITISKQKKELITKGKQHEYAYVAILKNNEWRLDSKRQRLKGGDWMRTTL